MKKILIIALAAAVVLCAAVFFAGRAGLFEKKPYPENDLICIDAGHGGNDPGAIKGGRYEKDDNLRLALLVASCLEDAGKKVVLTRDGDFFVGLSDRCDIANKEGAALFISFHRNSASDESVSGVEVWAPSNAGKLSLDMSERILKALSSVGISVDRGVKKGTAANPFSDYVVNRGTKMPSCLIEMGFITSDADNALFDENADAYAKAVADAVISLYPKGK
ncbi:MAG: N-acetylmuramoyl-L-alanine amidase [Clostridia bacterium]|nr:N-acetylmuramoyl-L-alanine amidase [Clostridia bacterium]